MPGYVAPKRGRSSLVITGQWLVLVSAISALWLIFFFDTTVSVPAVRDFLQSGRVVNFSLMELRLALLLFSLADMLLGGLFIVAGKIDQLRKH
jgi:hypothetical protein